MKAGRNKLLNPDGKEVYDPQLNALFQSDPTILDRICCLVVARMIELSMTNEEFVLLDMVFFCNPGIIYTPFSFKFPFPSRSLIVRRSSFRPGNSSEDVHLISSPVLSTQISAHCSFETG